MRRFLFCCSLFVLAALAAPVFAQAQTKEPPMPKPLIEQRVRGAQVYYLGNFSGLEGWMMIRTGQPEFYYATPDNKAIVMGVLFDGDGNLKTAEQLQVLERTRDAGVVDMMASQLPDEMKGDVRTIPDEGPDNGATDTPRNTATPETPAPAAQTQTPAATPETPPSNDAVAGAVVPNTPANRLYRDFMNATSLLWGQASAPAFYAIIDPNCPHCQRFLREVSDAVKAGRVSVRILPVGVDEHSTLQSAFLLAAGDGVDRLVRYANGDNEALPAPSGVNTSAVQANTRLLHTWNLRATPIIVYKAGKSGEIRLIRGRPLDIEAAIRDLIGG